MRLMNVAVFGAVILMPTVLLADSGPFSGPLHAAAMQQPYITVVGEARREVVPDRIAWQVSVVTLGESVAGVAAAHTPEVQAALTFLQAVPVAEEDVQTAHMQLQQRWRHAGKLGRVSDGFEARTRIQFDIGDFAVYENIWSGLSELPGVTIDSARFVTSNDPAVEDRLRLQALGSCSAQGYGHGQCVGSGLGAGADY